MNYGEDQIMGGIALLDLIAAAAVLAWRKERKETGYEPDRDQKDRHH